MNRKYSIAVMLLICVLLPGRSLLYGQEEAKQDLKQYLFPSFTRSSVLMKNGTTMTVMLNYNMVSEQMVFEQKGEYYDMANPEDVDTVYLNGKLFIPSENMFLEVWLNGKIPFFLEHKADLIQPPRPAGYGTTSQLTSSNVLSGINTPQGYYNLKLPDGFTVKPSVVYWIDRDGEKSNFLGQRQFLRLFPENQDDLKKFIKDEKLKFDRVDDMRKLAQYCNEQLK